MRRYNALPAYLIWALALAILLIPQSLASAGFDLLVAAPAYVVTLLGGA